MHNKLKNISLFSALPESDLILLSKQAVTKTYKKNTVMVNAGDETNSLYLILEGSVRVYLEDEQGKEVTINLLESGDSFGELALISGDPRSANVAALEDCRLAVISKTDFCGTLKDNFDICFQIISSLINRVQELTEDVSSLALKDVYGRVVRVIMKQSTEQDGKRVMDKLTQQEIANMVGSSREMVSRIFKELRIGNYISVNGNEITIEKKLPDKW